MQLGHDKKGDKDNLHQTHAHAPHEPSWTTVYNGCKGRGSDIDVDFLDTHAVSVVSLLIMSQSQKSHLNSPFSALQQKTDANLRLTTLTCCSCQRRRRGWQEGRR